MQQTRVSDPAAGRDFPVAFWYPTDQPEERVVLGPAVLSVSPDAEPAESIAGLVLISHGFSGSLLGHSNMARFLAANGYLVATPTHPDREGLIAGDLAADPLVARPRQLRLALDYAIEKFKIGNKPVGIVGFSLGAYAALVVLGATPNPAILGAYCQKRPRDRLLCSDEAGSRFRSLEHALQFTPDSRFSAAVLLAPAYGPLFSPQVLASVAAPVLIFSAENDEELDNRFNATHLGAALPESAGPVVIDRAGHFVFMAPCPAALAAELPALCRDPKGVDRAAVHDRINAEILAYFARVWQ